MDKTLKLALVVDDDEGVGDITAEMLDDLGFWPVRAGDALEALAILAKVQIDLVVTDVQIPGPMNGLGLVREIRTSWPAAKVLCVSGRYPETDVGALGGRFLLKPYTYRDFTSVVTGLTT